MGPPLSDGGAPGRGFLRKAPTLSLVGPPKCLLLSLSPQNPYLQNMPRIQPLLTASTCQSCTRVSLPDPETASPRPPCLLPAPLSHLQQQPSPSFNRKNQGVLPCARTSDLSTSQTSAPHPLHSPAPATLPPNTLILDPGLCGSLCQEPSPLSAHSYLLTAMSDPQRGPPLL